MPIYRVGMTTWRASPVVAVIVTCLFLAIQLAIPLSRLGSHDSAPRFAWQMFSTVREAPDFVLETESGSREISLGDYMAGPRGDIDVEGLMPPHLCALFPDVVRVTWQGGEFDC